MTHDDKPYPWEAAAHRPDDAVPGPNSEPFWQVERPEVGEEFSDTAGLRHRVTRFESMGGSGYIVYTELVR